MKMHTPTGTRTFWFFRDRTNRKSVYLSTHFHFCPSISYNLAPIPISSDFDLLTQIRPLCRLLEPYTLNSKRGTLIPKPLTMNPDHRMNAEH